jgi:hypothetical protein
MDKGPKPEPVTVRTEPPAVGMVVEPVTDAMLGGTKEKRRAEGGLENLPADKTTLKLLPAPGGTEHVTFCTSLATPAAAPDIVQLPRANSAPVTGPKVALMASCVVPAATRDAVKPTFDAWITMVEPVVAKLTSFAGDCEAEGAKAELAGELDAPSGVAAKPRTAARFVWLSRIVMGAEPVSGVSLESVHETVSAKLDWSSQASGAATVMQPLPLIAKSALPVRP